MGAAASRRKSFSSPKDVFNPEAEGGCEAWLWNETTTIPFLEEAGVEFSTEARSEAFASLLETHKIEFDDDEMLLHTQPLREADIPAAAMRFVSFMLRVNDFLLLTRDKIITTFKEDAAEMLRQRIGERANIQEGVPVTPAMADNVPDVVLRAPGRRPVAVFFGSSPQRVYDAVLLQMQALYEAQEDVAVIALLENDGIISRELRRRATNRLTALPSFRGDEFEAIHRIEREALGSLGATRH